MGGKGSGDRHVQDGRRAAEVDADWNHRSICFNRELFGLPRVDASDPASILERFDLFLAKCDEYHIRPLVGSFAMAFGLNRSDLYKLFDGSMSGVTRGFTPESIMQLKKCYEWVQANFENVLTNTKNPVPHIYYSKAILGWRETPNETVVTHRTIDSPRLKGKTADDVAEKYAQIVGVESVTPTYELPADSQGAE